MIKTHNSNGKEFLLVEVPIGAQLFSIVPHFKDIKSLKYIEAGIVFAPTKYVELPPGNYRILFLADEATEEQAALITREHHKDNGAMYRDYQCDAWACMTMKDSLQSLTRSLFPSTDNRILILEKLKA